MPHAPLLPSPSRVARRLVAFLLLSLFLLPSTPALSGSLHRLTADGVVGDWNANELVAHESMDDADFGTTNNLDRLYVTWDSHKLYLRVQGEFQNSGGNGFALFLDTRYGSASNGGSDLNTLGDVTGAVDSLITQPSFIESDPNFNADYAIAVHQGSSQGAGSTSDLAGLRGWGGDGGRGGSQSNFAWLDGADVAVVAGTPDEAEISIAWDKLYNLGVGNVPTDARLAIAVGYGSTGGGTANESLPTNGGGGGGTFTTFYTVDIDADDDGVPDAGLRTGNPSLPNDSTATATEPNSATTPTNSKSLDGILEDWHRNEFLGKGRTPGGSPSAMRYFLTWDATNFYVAFAGLGNGTSDRFNVLIDTNPAAPDDNMATFAGVGFNNAYEPDFAYQWNGTSLNKFQAAGAAWSDVADDGSGADSNSDPVLVELAIPRAGIGSPTGAVAFYLYAANSTDQEYDALGSGNAPDNDASGSNTFLTPIGWSATGTSVDVNDADRQLATFVVNSTADTVDAVPGDGSCATAGSVCTLRAAIQETNALAGPDTVTFNIAATPNILPTSVYPTITSPLFLDGTTQPGYGGSPIVQVSGNLAGAGVNGFTLSASASTIQGLVINRFTANGILITGAGATDNQVRGNYIGTNTLGTSPLANGLRAVAITGGAQRNTVGGLASQPGLYPGNLLSGNLQDGVLIDGQSSVASFNVVQGNIIGLGSDGFTRLRNGRGGILIQGPQATNNTIGGSTATARNIITGHNATVSSNAVELNNGTSFNTVAGNYLGLDLGGSIADNTLDNRGDGVHINGGAHHNTVGGLTATPGAPPGNVLAGNSSDAIEINGNVTTNNVVQGNIIGLAADGFSTVLVPGVNGVLIQAAPNNIVGGTTTSARNVISGLSSRGVLLNSEDPDGNQVMGNYIGTDLTGTLDRGNLSDGVAILRGGDNNIIGGPTTIPGTPPGNLIAGNGGDGIDITTIGIEPSLNNRVQGNRIGLRADADSALRNDGHGVQVELASNSTIGGLAANTGNVIAFNALDGVYIAPGVDTYGINNAIDPNSIFSNGGLGIDLGPDGPTLNDSGDVDTGANNLQNYPIFYEAVIEPSGDLVITYTVESSVANASYPLTIEFFEADSPASGEGQRFLGSDSYTVAQTPKMVNLGNAAALGIVLGDAVVSTATDSNGNTSEFNPPVLVPLAVALADFSATTEADHVRIAWETTSEQGNLGFNLYRATSASGPGERLNAELILSRAPGGQGARYQWEDSAITRGATYFYWLEDVDAEGRSVRHEPISVTIEIVTAVSLGHLATATPGPSLALGALALPALVGVALAWRRRRA